MAAVSDDLAPAVRPRISAIGLRRTLAAGMQSVLARRAHLNRINVFPVPDGDTGSNLAFTLGAVLDGSLRQPATSAGRLLRDVAEDAVDGARGNSGAILAQFLCGVSEAIGDVPRLSTIRIASAVRLGAEQARAALAEPREGTILSVISAFSHALQEPCPDLVEWFGNGLQAARVALARTPLQLAVLREAGVVDAGAQGFVDLLAGMHGDMLERKAAQAVAEVEIPAFGSAAAAWHEAADPARPWCSECLVSGAAVDMAALRAAIVALPADSVVVAGHAQRLRIHAHVADPGRLFERAGQFGQVSARKAENMLAQQRAAQRRSPVVVVTDSASDLPAEWLEDLPLEMVPVRVSFGDEDFLDRISLSNAEFHQRLIHSALLPQTSQPPPGDFRRQFELALSHCGRVVYVGLSRQLSGTLQSGETAAARFEPGRVQVIDSGQVSCAQALLVLAAAEAARSGAGIAEIADLLERLRPRPFLFAAARDIRHAVRGGRVPKWVEPLANWLGLTAIARIKADGRLAVIGGLLGRRRVAQRFARYIRRRLPGAQAWRVMVGHCGAPEEARGLLEALCARLEVERSWLVETGPAIGAHAGPGTLVVGLQAVEPAVT